ncbi:MAG: hypothetical protein L6R39_007124 [Caloplaca ligustica]|nr:MAG: hypothetical protein L6R39_007124 [Caloplaca ligustica]
MVDIQRLYVSPLDSQLLPTVLSGPLRESARNISYHTLQTFPEKRYGYLELPIPEADRLKKKLHGSILQGMKMKVEKARPEKTQNGPGDDDVEAGTERKTRKSTRAESKPEKKDGVLPGVELPNDRKVKRGWTEPSVTKEKGSTRGKKSKSKDNALRPSVHTEGPECLFKTTIPPNVARGAPSPQEATKPKKRKRGDTERSVVVHEFENTTKHPNFLRKEATAKHKKFTTSYIEGRGWADEGGNIVEAEKVTRTTRSGITKPASNNGDKAPTQHKNSRSKQTRSASSPRKARVIKQATTDDETSSSGSSASESEEPSHAQQGTSPQHERQSQATSEDSGTEDSSSSSESEDELNAQQVRALSIARSSPTPPVEATKEVHPLEALFKRPKNAASQTPQKPSLEVRTGFSFFEPDNEQDAPLIIPQTPFTQQDFQERCLRSAAPTPDTAAPSKTTFGRVWSGSGGRDSVSDDADDDAGSTPKASTSNVNHDGKDEVEESEFTKWFYEHRGETNRAWKRRRREAAKEKRQKENKRR